MSPTLLPPKAELIDALLQGDRQARNTLTVHFFPLVENTVGRYATKWQLGTSERFGFPSRGDLFQEGVLGLLAALDTYQPDRGTLRDWVSIKVRSSIQNHAAKVMRQAKKEELLPETRLY